MRRAIAGAGKKLGFVDPVLYSFVDVLVSRNGRCVSRASHPHDVRPRRPPPSTPCLTSARARGPGSRCIWFTWCSSARDAFGCYDSLGVPGLHGNTHRAAAQLSIDRGARASEGQRERPAPAPAFKGVEKALTPGRWPCKAIGSRYDATTVSGTPVGRDILIDGRSIDALRTGAKGYVALARTPFYLEAGGRVGQRANIGADGSSAIVERLVRPNEARHVSPASYAWRRAEIRRGQIVTAEFQTRSATRLAISTATHPSAAPLCDRCLAPRQTGWLFWSPRIGLRFDFVRLAAETSSCRRANRPGTLRC